MKITQDGREYAAQKEIDEQAALGCGDEGEGGGVCGEWWGDLCEENGLGVNPMTARLEINGKPISNHHIGDLQRWNYRELRR
jgi:hypothetical protein